MDDRAIKHHLDLAMMTETFAPASLTETGNSGGGVPQSGTAMR